MDCQSYAADTETIDRIKPIGQIRISYENKKPILVAKPTKQKVTTAMEDKGKAIYEQYCAVCHNAGLAGAPKFKDKAAWTPRLEEKKLEGLVKSAINGINAMPPKGTCQSCTEDDLKKAIQHMVP